MVGWMAGWMDEWHTLNTNECQLPKQTFGGGTQKAVRQQPRRIKGAPPASSSDGRKWRYHCHCHCTCPLLHPSPLALVNLPLRRTTRLCHLSNCIQSAAAGQTNATIPLYLNMQMHPIHIYPGFPWVLGVYEDLQSTGWHKECQFAK